MINSTDIANLTGSEVVDSEDDKVGTVVQVFVDPSDGQATWATVRTGLFGTSESFVPLDDATYEGNTLRIAFDKETVGGAPRVDTDSALSEEEEASLYEYYNFDSVSVDDSFADSSAGYAGSGLADTAIADDTVGYDVSGPTTDSAMTRSEERLNVATERVQTGRARLHKYIVTEMQTVTVPVSHEEVRLVTEPITDGNIGDALDGPSLSEEEHEVILTEERVVVTKETVPVERVRLDTETVTEQQEVTEEIRKERIELETDATTTGMGSADGSGLGGSFGERDGLVDDLQDANGDRDGRSGQL